MNFLKKNKIIVGIIIAALVVAGMGFLVLRNDDSSKAPVPSGDQTQNIKQIKPEDIGLELSLRSDRKAVVMTLTKLTSVKSIEYELSYDAEETVEGETNTVPKGAVGSPIEVAGKSEIKREILLGTCSANVCRYDKVKSNIKIVVRVNYRNGEIGAAEATIPFE